MGEILYDADINISRNQLLNARLQNLSSAPTVLSGDTGLFYWDTSNKVLNIWDGEWINSFGILQGTNNRIIISGSTNNRIIDISPNYEGQNTINVVGVITGGTWNADIIDSKYGGTGVNNSGTTLTILSDSIISGNNTGNQTFTISGDVVTTAMTGGTYIATLPDIVDSDTYNNVVVNSKGQVISGNTISNIPYQSLIDGKLQTGFIDGDNIDVYYDVTGRTITLTGDLRYQWRGETKTLISPWVSSAHTATIGSWFLYSSDGINFKWETSMWSFDSLMVSYVNYGTLIKFAIKETHGLMDHKSHEVFHYQIGTHKFSGGLLTSGTYAENTATDVATTPSFNSAIVKDEDFITNIPSWTQGTYTRMYVASGNTSVFDITGSTPFYGTTNAYLQVNNALTGTMSLGVNGRWYNIYQILLPATSDPTSQKYRMIMLQPQTTYTSLALAQAEDVRTLRLGELSNISPEFVINARITYNTSSSNNNIGKCIIATGGVTYVSGNKVSQISVNGLNNNHATLINLNWNDSNHNATPNSYASFDNSGNTTTTLIPYQITGITLNSTGWTLTSGLYEYSYNYSGITSSTKVEMIPNISSLLEVNTAQIFLVGYNSSGNVKFYCKNQPSDNIIISILITQIKT